MSEVIDPLAFAALKASNEALKLKLLEVSASRDRLRRVVTESQLALDGKCMRMALEYGLGGQFSVVICGATDEEEQIAMGVLLDKAKALGVLTGIGPVTETGNVKPEDIE